MLALWGALVSSFLLGWNLYREILGKDKVRVTCFIGGIIQGEEVSEKDYLVYRITNAGQKPVVITNVGGTLKDRQFILTVNGIPKMLQPGQYTTVHTPDLSILERSDLRDLWALDSLGKTWKVEKKVLSSLKSYR